MQTRLLLFYLIISIASNAQSTREQASKVPGNETAFIPNRGQIIDMNQHLRPDILFKSQGNGCDIYLRKTGISYVYSNIESVMQKINQQTERSEQSFDINPAEKQKRKQELMEKSEVKIHRIDLDFVNSLPAETLTEEQVEGYHNYYYAHCKNGITNVKSFNKITYKNIYDKINVRFYASAGSAGSGKGMGLKYDIVVKPGGNVNEIKLKYSGQESIELKYNKLFIHTPSGEIEESMPKVYQNINGKIIDIEAEYVLSMSSPGATGERLLTFSIPDYDKHFDLVIDPWATYYGGSSYDLGTGIATDNSGNVVMTGATTSIDFPVFAGTQMTPAGMYDSFVAKFDAAGNRLWSTYYGGSKVDYSKCIATDNSGNIVIAGSTASPDLPVLAGYQMTLTGSTNAFVLKLNPSGVEQWATYYGGTTYEQAWDIATDKAGNVDITGTTLSTDFPVFAGYQMTDGGSYDAFVVQFDLNGNRNWATFYGGNDYEAGSGIATDNAGNISITGMTYSYNLPVFNGYQMSFGGGSTDVFVVQFNSAGARQWATYYGGTSYDQSMGMTTDNAGNILITGFTGSTDFPVLNAYQPVYGGSAMDDYLVKFNSAGVRQWATYFGGNVNESASDIATDNNNNVYLLGDFEDAGPGNYPISSCAYQSLYGGGVEDQFIAKYDTAGQQHCVTYLGGTTEDDNDNNGGIAIYANSIYVDGSTNGGYPVTTGAFQTSYAGATDAFVTSLCTNLCEAPVLGLNFSASSTNVCSGVPVKLVPSVANSCDTSGYKFHWVFTGGVPSTSDSIKPTVTFSAIGTHDVKLVVTTACKKDSLTNSGYITVTPCSVLSSDVTKTDVLCHGNLTGSATVTAIGGIASYTYTWSNGASTTTTSATNTVTGLSANTYTVTIADGSANTTSTTVTITEPLALTLLASSTNATCGTSNGQVNATPGGGTGGYTFSWMPGGATGQTVTGLSANTYTVTITDSNGCTKTASTIINNTSAVVAGIASSANVSCNAGSNGSVTASTTGGTGGYTFSWMPGGATSQTLSGLSANTYTVTITDANSCTSTATVAITEPPAIITPAFTIINATCGSSNGSAVASASGGTGTLTYSWSNTASGQTALALASGPYTVTVTDANACTMRSTVLIGNNNGPVVQTTTPVNELCNGNSTGSAALTISGGSSPYTYSWSNGTSSITNSLNNSITSLPANTYVVTVTDKNGCTATTSIIITEPAAISTPVITPSNASCGASDGSAIALASGGTGSLTYNWSNLASGQTASALSSATYTVSVTDANGCAVTNTVAIGNANGPSVQSTTPVNELCHGASAGSASVSISGGSSPYTYSWSNAVSSVTTSLTNSITSLPAGSYIVTISDNNSCTTTTSINVTEPSAISIPSTSAANSTCGNANGSATALSSGGTGTLTYSWSNGASGQTATNLLVQAYTVSVTDANNCTVTKTVTVGNDNAPLVSLNVTSAISCNSGTGSIIATATGGNPNYTYSWSPGGTNFVTSSLNHTITSLTANTYTVTITDVSGCSHTSSILLTEPSVIVINSVAPVNSNCGTATGSAIASASGGTGVLTYTWNNFVSGQTNNNLSANTYTVTVTDANACAVSSTVTINNNGGPTIIGINKTNVGCNGDSSGLAVVYASGTGSLSYSWSSGSVITVDSGLVAGTYTVTVTDTNSCSSMSTVTITQPPAFVVSSFIEKNAGCNLTNGSVEATVSGGTGLYTYSWSSGSSSITSMASDSITSLPANTYSLIVTDANGCSVTRSTIVNNTPAPAITGVSPSNVSCNGSANGKAVVSATGTGALTYSWSNGPTSIIDSNLVASTYTVTVKDANGCQAISTVAISQPPILQISNIATTSANCNKNDGSANASATGGTAALTYSWSASGGSGATVSGLTAGNYTLTVTDANGCSLSNTLTINSTNGPSVLASATTILCNGQSGNVTATASNGTLPYTYSWSTGATSVTTATQATLINQAAAIYSVTITDKNGCTSTSSITLSEPPALVITTTKSDATCGNADGTILVTTTGGVLNYTYSWSNDSINPQITNLNSGTYGLTVTDANGCLQSTVTTITNSNAPVAGAASSQTTITEGNSTLLIGSSTGTGVTYTWTPGASLNCSNCATPTANPGTTTTYTLYVKDNLGCTDSANVTITVKKACSGNDDDVFIANIFSPNGDGKNDVLNIEGNGLTNIYWAIYDRWGNLIFETTNIAQGWDGTKNGSPMEAATYVYYLKAICTKTKAEVKLKGNVSVVK